ncbi:MAG TPA: xanthine dehydrogenase family protein subunit M [Actinomycetota bacterium]|nr:xanthine dehydrogenase family protein subunit M [Actinomycetota bacterium]
MIPAAFDYEVADSVDHALETLSAAGPDAKLLAGGHSLLPLMKLRLATPSMLIDIGRIGSLSYVRDDGDVIAIGPLTRHHDLHRSDVLAAGCPILAHAAGQVGDPQVRHKGTIGGSVAHGDPASDLPAALVALGAEFVIRGGGNGGTRTVAATDFYTGFLTTVLAPTEMLVEIRVPKRDPDSGWSYIKFNRRAQDWGIVGVAALVGAGDAELKDVRVGLANMGPTPLRATAVEQALEGAGKEAIAGAAEAAAEGTDPVSDTNASAGFRRHLAKVLVRRALEAAAG